MIYRSSNTILQNYIDGCVIDNNGTFPNTSIDIGAGVAADQSANQIGLMRLTSLLGQKHADAAWVQGGGVGGLDQGSSIGANGSYHVYLITLASSGVVDAAISVSATGPGTGGGFNLPALSGYRRIGAFTTDGSAHIRQFTQVGDTFLYNPGFNFVTPSIATTGTTFNIPVPSGVTFSPFFVATMTFFNNNQGNATNFAGSPALGQALAVPATYTVPATSTSMTQAYTCVGGSAGEGSADCQNPTSIVKVPTANGQIQARTSAAAGAMNLYMLGWEDRRGKG